MTTFIKADIPMTSPLPGTRRGPGTVLFESRFSIADTPSIVGGNTAPGPGLTVGTWEGTVNALAIKNNELVRGTAGGVWSCGLPLPDTAAMVSVDVVKLPTADQVFLDIFRAAFTGTPDCYRLYLISDGTARLAVRAGGANEYVGSSFPYAAGDRVGVRWVGGLLEAVVNERVAQSYVVNSVLPRGYAAISGTAASAGFTFDNVGVDTY